METNKAISPDLLPESTEFEKHRNSTIINIATPIIFFLYAYKNSRTIEDKTEQYSKGCLVNPEILPDNPPLGSTEYIRTVSK
jgi:hypothetical protein